MKNIILIIIYITAIKVYAQEDGATIVSKILEEMASDGTLTEDIENEASELTAIAEEKLNLNDVTFEQLRKLVFLNDKQAETLIDHRERFGPYVSEMELITLPGFRYDDILRLIKFVYIGNPNRNNERIFRTKADIVARAQRTFPEQKGFKTPNDSTSSAFLGSHNKTLVRGHFTIADTWSGGFVAESDAGEPRFSHGVSVTDFLSGHLAYTPKDKFVRKAIIGHFSIHYGQGLGLWTGFSADMSSVQSSIMKNGNGINSNMSSSESGYLRGIAIALGTPKVRLDIFGSSTDNDGTLITKEDSTTYVTAIQTDGYHRTKNELKDRNNFKQTFLGTYLRVSSTKLTVGMGHNSWQGSKQLGNKGELYKLFYPEGMAYSTSHLDFKYLSNRLAIYGEIAYQSLKALAGMQGIDIELGNGNTLTVAYRKFGKKYYCTYQKPFSKASKPGGENGFYLGLQIAPTKNMTLLANVNIYRNEWLQYHKPAPTHGTKSRINMTYIINSSNSIQIRIRQDHYEDSSIKNRTKIDDTKRTDYKLTWNANVNESLSFKTMIESVKYKQSVIESKGFWVSEDIRVETPRKKGAITLEMAHFDTDDYYSRIYATHPDVLYSMSMASYSGRGILAIIRGKLSPTNSIDLWAWGGYTKYMDRVEIGTGYNTINSNHKLDVKVQARLKFRHWKRRYSELSRQYDTN